MKQVLPINTLFISVLITVFGYCCQAQGYTWIKGSNSTNQPGAYGTIGSASLISNPGSRNYCLSWKDSNGNFWMFGGEGYDFIANSGYLNDLWKYQTSNNTWIWMKGDNLIAQAGIYGTIGVPAPGNKPGGRSQSATWSDNGGNLYLFGGYGYDAAGTLGYLNDLWRYSTASNQWTWIGGTNLANQAGIYGAITVASPINVPGGRYCGTTWTDAAGNLWLFGGFGSSTFSTSVGHLNDLWKYDLNTNEWTWMKGSSVINQNGAYGTLAVSSATNTPGARHSKMCWKDAAGNFWMFGGEGFDNAANTASVLNDLWKYDILTGEWVWMHGSNTNNQSGIYGNPNASAPGNTPGARNGSYTWTDGAGNFWLAFGNGYGINATSTGKLNDLWLYNSSSNQWKWVAGGGGLNFGAIYGTIGTFNSLNIPGARRFGAHWVDASNNLWLFGGYGEISTAGTPSQLNDLWKYYNCQINPTVLTITTSNGLVCAGETVTLSVTGASNYTWSTGSTVPSIFVAPKTSSTYIASTSGSNNCTYSATFTQNINPCTAINSNTGSQIIRFYPNPACNYLNIGGSQTNDVLVFYNLIGKQLNTHLIKKEHEQIQIDLNPGVYFYTLTRDNKAVSSGKLIVEGNR